MKLKLIERVGPKTDKGNLLINGDNLGALNQIKEHLVGKIDVIYIDPPYNTGKKMGKYSDSFKSHDAWVGFMRPRIVLAKEFMADHAMIFISIGEQEEAHLKLLCNEIFGEDNKVSSITWQCKHTVANDKNGISSQTEYILVYAKNIKNIKLNNDPLREEYVKAMYKNIDNDPEGPWRGGVQLYKKKNTKTYTVTSPTGKKWTLPWNYSEDQWYETLEKNKLIYWGKDGNSCPVKKVYLKNTKGINIKNLWLGSEVGYTEDGGNTLENMFESRNSFLYPKPVSLMKRILQIATNKDSLIMDFFAGSGTMGHAGLEFNQSDGGNRRFILITNDEDSICSEVTFPRLKKVIEGYSGKDEVMHEPIAASLVYFGLDSSSDDAAGSIA
jgi:adenine-specific DNA-methyltransferase